MAPVGTRVPTGAVVPTAASLDALEAMEAGLHPATGGGGGACEQGVADAQRRRHFRGWRCEWLRSCQIVGWRPIVHVCSECDTEWMSACVKCWYVFVCIRDLNAAS